MSLRSALMGAASRQQRGIAVAVGARFVRGRRLVTVTATEEDGVTWRDDLSGETSKGRRADFAGLALTKVKAVVDTSADAASPMAAAWDLASSSGIAFDERYELLTSLFAGILSGTTGTDEDRANLRRWLLSLMARVEPEREAPRVE